MKIYNFFFNSKLSTILTFLMILSALNTINNFNLKYENYNLKKELKKCEQIKLIPHCSEREIILFKDVIDKCFIERD